MSLSSSELPDLLAHARREQVVDGADVEPGGSEDYQDQVGKSSARTSHAQTTSDETDISSSLRTWTFVRAGLLLRPSNQ